jgi:transcriptional regulator with XRE-family HTH domain
MGNLAPILKGYRKGICGIDKISKGTGLSRSQIINIEKGERNYTIASLEKYLTYIGCRIEIKRLLP